MNVVFLLAFIVFYVGKLCRGGVDGDIIRYYIIAHMAKSSPPELYIIRIASNIKIAGNTYYSGIHAIYLDVVCFDKC